MIATPLAHFVGLMPIYLANAQGADASDSNNLIVVLICLGIIVGACILAAIPVVIAAARRHRQARGILAVAVVWALLTSLFAITVSLQELQWSKERTLLIQTGYFDPQNSSGAPATPGWLWAIPAVFYVGLLVFSLLPKKSRPPEQNNAADLRSIRLKL